MADRKLYGWKENGKYYVSKSPDSVKYRPRNEYETMQAAMTEAAKRGIKIEWANGVVD